MIVDFTDYENYPIGGYLTFAKNMMESFGNDLALAGITTSKSDPIGRWSRKKIAGVEYDFFAIARYNKAKTRNRVPDRMVNLILARWYKRRILRIGIKNIFVQRQESLIAIAEPGKNICYSFPGLENPLAISKYSYAPPLAGGFEKNFFRKLGFVNVILARGDDEAIRQMVNRSNGLLQTREIVKFPTRINTSLFRPGDKLKARQQLQLPEDKVLVISTGRLASIKGWRFMIDSFIKFSLSVPNAHLILVGEGEDFDKINLYISEQSAADKIFLAGKKGREDIALYLNASDLYIMGSLVEGWPTALMEAVACGLPACITEFSAATEIIDDGINGYIVKQRDETLFAQSMEKALKLQRPVENGHVTRYSTERLKEDMLYHWKLS